MNMTREEAINILSESKRQNEVMRDNPSTFWASHQMADGVKNAERRIAALGLALSALRPVSREQVEKVWRGEWEYHPEDYDELTRTCSRCGEVWTLIDGTPDDNNMDFCPACGAPMTDEAVDIVLRRLEALKDGKGD